MSVTDFELLAKVGEGSFSSVFKALRRPDKTVYALKKVLIRSLKDKEKQNALNEIRILASIDHPNIISYKQAFFDQFHDSLCIVMEYADAGDLLKLITEHQNCTKLISESFLWDLLIKLTQALKVLHDMNIMHRDVKSANVFLTKDGKIKLGDLNVSKVVKDSLHHTQTGTPNYASPEVWKNEPYDYKCDMWSLGCVIYHAAALKLPFQAATMKSLYKKVIKGVFAPLSEFSEDLNEIVKLLLTLDPEIRPNATDILNHELVQKRMKAKEKLKQSKSVLLRTIKVKDNLSDINSKLPAARFPHSARESLKQYELPSLDRIKRYETTKFRDPSIYKSKIEKKYSLKNMLNNHHAQIRLAKVRSTPLIEHSEI